MIVPPFKTFDTPPGISVLCPTYGRAARLPGLVESFLRQDYAGPKELIILNDRPDQTIDCARPEVFVYNNPEQFATLGAKRNQLLDLAQMPYVAWWDDDDRFLPGRLRRGVELLRAGYRGSLESRIWLSDSDAPDSLLLERPWSPFATALIERETMLDAGGFPEQQMLQDVALNHILVHQYRAFYAEADTGAPTVIYRQPGTSAHTHVGSFNGDKTNNDQAREYMRSSVDVRVLAGTEPTGMISIAPAWERDFVDLCARAWASYLAT